MSHESPRGDFARCGLALALAVMTMLLVMALPRSASGQISPGKLARAHASLEGSSQCVQCHSLSRAPMATSCLNCHKDVKALIDQKRGYHARLTATQRQECSSCHPDHAGVDFAMIAWPGAGKAKFDHKDAGWALEGKHIEAKCEDCHTAKYRKSPVAALSKRKTGTPWMGFEATCNSCHASEDIHEGALKGGCDKCHDAKKWAPAPTFEHDDARYALDGKHVDVKCDKCHATAKLPLKLSAKGEKIPLYRPVPYAKCNDCHADPHKGRLRESCSSCHETKGWDAIDKRDFNHDATRYPLKGKHDRVTCAACHGKGNEKPTPAYGTCASCHNDVHRNEAGRTRDCAVCHAVAGFTPATYTVAQHATTAYPLEGKHTSTKCAACHTTVRSAAGATAGSVLGAP
ncbi:MAG: cytochrome c3 family protein, partial [Gemmatimonas sp.]